MLGSLAYLLQAVHWLPSTVLRGNSKIEMHALPLHWHWFLIGNKHCEVLVSCSDKKLLKDSKTSPELSLKIP